MPIDPWARVDVSTTNKHIKRLTKPIYRDHWLMAALRNRKRFKFGGQRGKKFDWRLAYKRLSPVPYDDMDDVGFQRTNLWTDCELPYRAYSLGEAVSKFEELANGGGDVALFKILDELLESMMESMNDYFAEQLFIDGNASGNTLKIHGLESWLGQSGTSGKLGTASDTYAGKSTVLGSDKGGTWTGTWPFPGTGDEEYEFFTPLLVKYDSSSWESSGTAFADTWRECFDFAMLAGAQRKVKYDTFLLSADLYQTVLNSLYAKESIRLTRGAEGSLAIKLGFDALNYGGVDIVTEYGMPSSTGYGIKFDSITMRSMQPQLFVWDKDTAIVNKTKRFSLDFFGNMNIDTPRNSCKFYAFS